MRGTLTHAKSKWRGAESSEAEYELSDKDDECREDERVPGNQSNVYASCDLTTPPASRRGAPRKSATHRMGATTS